MDLGNSVNIVMYYLLIGGMTSWQLEWVFHGECTNACDPHWIGLMMNQDIRI